MAELETAAWKDDRRFRLLSLDGRAFSFVDLFFHTPSRPLHFAAGGNPLPHAHLYQDHNISITGMLRQLPTAGHTHAHAHACNTTGRVLVHRQAYCWCPFPAGVASEVVVRDFIVHITSPPDARYSAHQAAHTDGAQGQWGQVRALVLPVIAGSPAASALLEVMCCPPHMLSVIQSVQSLYCCVLARHDQP